LSYLANTQTDRQTDKQTKSGKNITSLAAVINIIKCTNLMVSIISKASSCTSYKYKQWWSVIIFWIPNCLETDLVKWVRLKRSHKPYQALLNLSKAYNFQINQFSQINHQPKHIDILPRVTNESGMGKCQTVQILKSTEKEQQIDFQW